METLWQDIRFGFRMLTKNPGFTAVAVLTLALGIGANTAIFSVVNAILLQPLPYPEPDRLVRIQEFTESFGAMSTSWLNYLDWAEQNSTFEAIAAFQQMGHNFGGEGDPVRIYGANVTGNSLSLLGVEPLLGRTFLPEEDQPGGERVVLLSYRFWQDRFGGDPDVLNQTVTLDNVPYVIVGVMPQGFEYPYKDTSVWTSLGFHADWHNFRGIRPGIGMIGRLKAGVTLDQADADLNLIADRLEELYPETNAGGGVKLTPWAKDQVRQIRTMLWVLLGAVGFVLLVACANVANLLLARAAARDKEIAIRTALGAGRLRVIRQLLTESLLLAGLGGAAGALMAAGGLRLLIGLLPPDVPRMDQIRIDPLVLAFALGISLATGILFGLAPALSASRTDLQVALKEGGRSTGATGRSGMQNLLVGAEVALALVLLMGAGLMARTFLSLQEVKPGFDSSNLLTMALSLPAEKYRWDDVGKRARRTLFQREMLDRVGRLPGVVSAATTYPMPMSGNSWTIAFVTEENPNPPNDSLPWTEIARINPGYFQTMRLPLLRGRFFTEEDKADAPPVVIIDRGFAHRLWPGEDPLGKRIKPGSANSESRWRTVVGVVGHVKLKSLADESWNELYVPQAQSPLSDFRLLVRTAGEPYSVTESVRKAILEVDPDVPAYEVRAMDSVIGDTVRRQSVSLILLGLFSALALVLAGIGIYGVIGYSVTQRTHEIGIRMALGAQPRDIFKLVVGQGMVLVLIGVAVGVAASFALSRFLESLLFGVTPTDPATFAGVAALLASVALLACYLPARRAARLDPMVALRYE